MVHFPNSSQLHKKRFDHRAAYSTATEPWYEITWQLAQILGKTTANTWKQGSCQQRWDKPQVFTQKNTETDEHSPIVE